MNSYAEGENDKMGIPNSRDRSQLNYQSESINYQRETLRN